MQLNKKKIILLLSWRDIMHPKSGGAEVFTTEMLKNIDLTGGYELVHFSAKNVNAAESEVIDNVRYIRKGNVLTVILHAMLFYFSNKKNIVSVIDQANTHRFFTPFWVPRQKRVFFIHQMTREIWKINLPNFFGWVGEQSENFMTKIYKNNHVLTVSNSTKNDLLDLNFEKDKITVLPEGVSHKPTSWPLKLKNNSSKIFLYVGRYSEYKGLTDTVKAFAEVCIKHPKSQLIVLGKKNNEFIEKNLNPILQSYNLEKCEVYDKEKESCVFLLDRVSEELKLEYMENADLLIYPSQREGWGLSVTEAAVLGTPSIVYRSAGLIDAVNEGKAGFVCAKNSPEGLRDQMLLVLNDAVAYEEMRKQAYLYSIQFRWEKTAQSFYNFIKEKQDVAS